MEPQTRRRAAWADIREFLVRAGALAALLVMLFGVVFGLYIQPDAAMHPHLKPGDLLLFYRLPRSCTAGEVVVFTKDGQRRTGRVAARGGDTVEVTDAAAKSGKAYFSRERAPFTSHLTPEEAADTLRRLETVELTAATVAEYRSMLSNTKEVWQ